MKSQLKAVGMSLASLIHVSMSWDESMSKQDIETIADAFRNELLELNGRK